MDAIAAVFIGTAFTRLGRVSILGTLGGVLFLAIIDNGLNLMGLNYLVKDALVGVILVVALALSFWQARAPNASLNGRTMATFDAVFVGLTILDIAGRPVVAIRRAAASPLLSKFVSPAGTAAGLISTPRSRDPHRSGGLPGRR